VDINFNSDRRFVLTACHSPDEYPFTTGLPAPVTPSLNFPKILYPNDINANPSILKFYIEFLVPALTRQASDAIVGMKRSRGLDGDDSRDDGNHGSAATLDVELLQTISKRVHYGKATCCKYIY
jgi:chorismate mutase